jgi:hypothetical protein
MARSRPGELHPGPGVSPGLLRTIDRAGQRVMLRTLARVESADKRALRICRAAGGGSARRREVVLTTSPFGPAWRQSSPGSEQPSHPPALPPDVP